MTSTGETVVSIDRSLPKPEQYRVALAQILAVLEGEKDPQVWMPTVACMLKSQFDFLWVGFYRADADGLHIGPYQGSLGCLHIQYQQGVCGAAASAKRTLIVADVHQFPGHIACDGRSNSEIVVPVLDNEGSLRGVLDVDSDQFSFFDAVDQQYLESLVSHMRDLEWTHQR